MSVPLVIYHYPCQDGFTAAWAVWKAHPDWEFYPAKHGEPPPDATGRDVYFVDFSYKRPVIPEMAAKASRIVILDHHKTAEADLVDILKSPTDEKIVSVAVRDVTVYNSIPNLPWLIPMARSIEFDSASSFDIQEVR